MPTGVESSNNWLSAIFRLTFFVVLSAGQVILSQGGKGFLAKGTREFFDGEGISWDVNLALH